MILSYLGEEVDPGDFFIDIREPGVILEIIEFRQDIHGSSFLKLKNHHKNYLSSSSYYLPTNYSNIVLGRKLSKIEKEILKKKQFFG